MSELIIPTITCAVGVSLGSLVSYAIMKRMTSPDKILGIIDDVTAEIQTNPELQQRIYMVGAIVGKGVRDGVGIDKMIPKRKGGIEGIIYDLLGGWLRDKMPQNEGQEKEHKEDRFKKPW